MGDWERRWRWTLRYGRPLLEAGFRIESSLPDLPAGRLVVAANHYSFVDPPMVGAALRRPIRFLAVSDLWDHPKPFVRILEGYGTVPLHNTGRPVSALRIARDHLLAEGTVGIFPEGRRVAEWGDEVAKRGAAWLSMRTGSPLLPVYIHGTEGTLSLREPRFRLVRVAIRIGEPIDPAGFPTGKEGLQELSEAWVRAMDALADG